MTASQFQSNLFLVEIFSNRIYFSEMFQKSCRRTFSGPHQQHKGRAAARRRRRTGALCGAVQSRGTRTLATLHPPANSNNQLNDDNVSAICQRGNRNEDDITTVHLFECDGVPNAVDHTASDLWHTPREISTNVDQAFNE